MGFNVSGLAINQNCRNNFQDIVKELGWNIKKEGDIDFEDASSNWKEKGICDVYFSENGTLIFMEMENCIGPHHLNDADTLTFAVSESSMAFNLDFSQKGKGARSLMEAGGQLVVDEGEKMEGEKDTTDMSEIIWNQLGNVLGKSYWDIEPNEKAERYRFVIEEVAPTPKQKPKPKPKAEQPKAKKKAPKTTKPNKQIEQEKAAKYEKWKQDNAERLKPRKWWEFWK